MEDCFADCHHVKYTSRAISLGSTIAPFYYWLFALEWYISSKRNLQHSTGSTPVASFVCLTITEGKASVTDSKESKQPYHEC